MLVQGRQPLNCISNAEWKDPMIGHNNVEINGQTLHNGQGGHRGGEVVKTDGFETRRPCFFSPKPSFAAMLARHNLHQLYLQNSFSTI